MVRATWNGVVLAEADDTVVVEGNHYFPPDALNREYFAASDHQSVCSWKGQASYYNVRLGVAIPDPRCVMTTLAQDELPKDNEVLRTLARQNRLDVAGGLYPCAGVYATVESTGTIRPGDSVSLT
jgi:Domain of unknown function (DUF427)/MOSC domain